VPKCVCARRRIRRRMPRIFASRVPAINPGPAGHARARAPRPQALHTDAPTPGFALARPTTAIPRPPPPLRRRESQNGSATRPHQTTTTATDATVITTGYAHPSREPSRGARADNNSAAPATTANTHATGSRPMTAGPPNSTSMTTTLALQAPRVQHRPAPPGPGPHPLPPGTQAPGRGVGYLTSGCSPHAQGQAPWSTRQLRFAAPSMTSPTATAAWCRSARRP
jgi:hypothetical protein